MNALTIIETASPFEDWLDRLRAAVADHQSSGWAVADCLAEGREQGHLTQVGFDFLSENLGVAPKRLKDYAKAAESFPPHMRDKALSIEHHVSVAGLDKQEALPLLQAAKVQHWTPERTRAEAMQRTDEERMPRTGRDEDSLLESLIHHWNRTPRSVRLAFAERVAESHGEEIEP
jgi:hypothetical protein